MPGAFFARSATEAGGYPEAIRLTSLSRGALPALLIGTSLVAALTGCGAADRPAVSIGDAPTTSANGQEEPPSPRPEAIAPRVQLLSGRCEDGNDDACTELATLVSVGTEDYEFAVTCGGRYTAPLCTPNEE